MPRYKLRTLLILLAIGPHVLAEVGPLLIDWLCPPPPMIEVMGQLRQASDCLRTP